MEAEQEASVNRLLHQIRDQQAQIRQLQLDQPGVIAEEGGGGVSGSASGAEDGAATTEVAFYQTETSLLARENQMLRHRVRELERQLEAMQVPKDESAGEN